MSEAQILLPDSELLAYQRILELKNDNIDQRLGIFPSLVNQYQKDSLEWNVWSEHYQPQSLKNKDIRLETIQFSNFYNSGYPRGYNDGAIWKGKGLTTVFQAGVSGKYGMIEYSFAPVIYYSQNAEYELAPQNGNTNIYNYQFNRNVDFVQRYGDNSFTDFDWGQSAIHFVYKAFSIGASTQNVVWGPAQLSPMLLSNNAAGIPHVELGTHKPVNTKIGAIESKFYWGKLRESDYYDDNEENNNRFWAGFVLAYNPSFLPGLTLGFNRAFYKKAEEFVNKDLAIALWRFSDPNDIEGTNDEFDQMGSATVRWLFKEVGFEAYLEFGKNDFGGKLIASAEPEHARGYTLGFSKYVDVLKTNVLKLTYEHTTIDKAKSGLYRGHNSWYTHGIVKHGYTQNGQVLGAGIGPGSNTDFFDAQYFFKSGRIQLIAQRIRFNDDYFIENIEDKFRHDHEWTMEAKYSQYWKGILVGVRAARSSRTNIYYELDNDMLNWSFGLTLTKQFNQKSSH